MNNHHIHTYQQLNHFKSKFLQMRKEEEERKRRRRKKKWNGNPKRRKISSYHYSIVIIIIILLYIHLIDIQKEGKLIIIFINNHKKRISDRKDSKHRSVLSWTRSIWILLLLLFNNKQSFWLLITQDISVLKFKDISL